MENGDYSIDKIERRRGALHLEILNADTFHLGNECISGMQKMKNKRRRKTDGYIVYIQFVQFPSNEDKEGKWQSPTTTTTKTYWFFMLRGFSGFCGLLGIFNFFFFLTRATRNGRQLIPTNKNPILVKKRRKLFFL
jgi:hypothetical protein